MLINEAFVFYMESVEFEADVYRKPNRALMMFKSHEGYRPHYFSHKSTFFLNKEKGNAAIIKKTYVEEESMEKDIATTLKHPNIVETSKFEIWNEEYLFLFSEYLDVCLIDTCKKFDEKDLKNLLRDILKGLKYMHDNYIVHLDLKIDNICGKTQQDGTIIYKIIDFNLAHDLRSDLCPPGNKYDEESIFGTVAYMSPEITYGWTFGYNTDMWSVGMISYYIARKKIMFLCRDEETTERKYRKFLKKPIIRKLSKHSEELKDFIEKCLVIDMCERMSSENALKHPFITKEINE